MHKGGGNNGKHSNHNRNPFNDSENKAIEITHQMSRIRIDNIDIEIE